MKFVMNRTHTVASVLGHSIAFVKDAPTHVPSSMHREVIAAGAVAVDGKVDFDDTVKVIEAPADEDRIELLKMALAEIKTANERESFTAIGVPKVKVVETALGFKVTSEEISDTWNELHQAEG